MTIYYTTDPRNKNYSAFLLLVEQLRAQGTGRTASTASAMQAVDDLVSDR